MWPIWILTGMISLSGYVIMSNEVKTPAINQLRSEELAGNMGVYRASVLEFMQANPSFTGTVSDEQLIFPSWGYNRNPLWTNDVRNGTVVVYATSLPPVNFIAELVKLSKNSIFAGEANTVTNTVFSPVFGSTQIPLPPGVPSGAPVWAASIN